MHATASVLQGTICFKLRGGFTVRGQPDPPEDRASNLHQNLKHQQQLILVPLEPNCDPKLQTPPYIKKRKTSTKTSKHSAEGSLLAQC
ncbi:hypothetical protein BaRGS_00028978 [Batillaria attramentaria]|uniref:Uncharacterized protein n=1 Tax=Batillaria attramentaria TaxID=370345 RepID=A0ABD0JXZ8_9CAEN